MVATGSKLLVVRNCQNSHTLTAQTSKKIYHAVARAGIKRRSRFIHYQYRFIEYLGNRQHNPLSLSTRHLVHTLVIKLSLIHILSLNKYAYTFIILCFTREHISIYNHKISICKYDNLQSYLYLPLFTIVYLLLEI